MESWGIGVGNGRRESIRFANTRIQVIETTQRTYHGEIEDLMMLTMSTSRKSVG